MTSSGLKWPMCREMPPLKSWFSCKQSDFLVWFEIRPGVIQSVWWPVATTHLAVWTMEAEEMGIEKQVHLRWGSSSRCLVVWCPVSAATLALQTPSSHLHWTNMQGKKSNSQSKYTSNSKNFPSQFRKVQRPIRIARQVLFVELWKKANQVGGYIRLPIAKVSRFTHQKTLLKAKILPKREKKNSGVVKSYGYPSISLLLVKTVLISSSSEFSKPSNSTPSNSWKHYLFIQQIHIRNQTNHQKNPILNRHAH